MQCHHTEINHPGTGKTKSSTYFYLIGFNPNRVNNQEDPLCNLPPLEQKIWRDLDITPELAQ